MSDKNPKILIIDNDVEICNLLKDFFDFIGYDSFFYTDCKKLLRELHNLEYDLMFVDLKLDSISGIEVLKKSKEIHPLSEVIIVTGFGSEETIFKSLHYGASSFIQKPISFSDIKVQTKEALAIHRFNTVTDRLKNSIRSNDATLLNHFDKIINLDKLSGFLNLTIDLDLLGLSILNGIAQILPGKYYSFFFYDEVNKEMAIYTSTHLSPKKTKSLENKVKDTFEKLINKKVSDTYNLRVSQIEVENNKGTRKSLKNLSNIFVPILIGNSVRGVLGISDDTVEIKDDTKDMLELVSMRVASVLANATLHHKAKLLAITDGLTGLLNHRAFDERLNQEFRRFRRYGSYLSLILADFDNLKTTNDTYGHPVGDEALKKVGETLQEMSRDSDVLARYGGDEFVILLPETNVENAINMAERIRLNVSKNAININENTITNSITMGISTAPQEGIKTSHDLLKSADKALYEAKRAGKNRVAVAKY